MVCQPRSRARQSSARKILSPIALSPRTSRSMTVARTSGSVVWSFMSVHLECAGWVGAGTPTQPFFGLGRFVLPSRAASAATNSAEAGVIPLRQYALCPRPMGRGNQPYVSLPGSGCLAPTGGRVGCVTAPPRSAADEHALPPLPTHKAQPCSQMVGSLPRRPVIGRASGTAEQEIGHHFLYMAEIRDFWALIVNVERRFGAYGQWPRRLSPYTLTCREIHGRRVALALRCSVRISPRWRAQSMPCSHRADCAAEG